MRWLATTCDSLQISLVCVRVYSITLYKVWVYMHVWGCICSYVSCLRLKETRSILLDPSQPCLPVCAVVWCLLWLVRIRKHKLFLPECLQLRPTVGQSSMEAVFLLHFQLSTEQNEARDANNEGDSPQAQSQAQVRYPEKLRCQKYS